MESSTETYVAVCKCGQIHSVLAYEAGDERMCSRCSKPFRIPFILKTPAQQIESMIQYNQLPSNQTCPFTGEEAQVRVDIGVFEGDRPFKIPRWVVVTLLLTLFNALLVFLLLRRSLQEEEETEEPEVVVVPLRIADDPEAYDSLANEEELVEALRIVPIYNHLIDSYAYAQACVANHEPIRKS